MRARRLVTGLSKRPKRHERVSVASTEPPGTRLGIHYPSHNMSVEGSSAAGVSGGAVCASLTETSFLGVSQDSPLLSECGLYRAP